MSKEQKKDDLEEDTDYTDEQGGGGDLMTEEEFDNALYKATRKLEDEETEEESPVKK